MMREPEYLLDASTILDLVQNERGADTVYTMLPTSAISAVNLAEGITKLVKRTVIPRALSAPKA